MDVITKIKVVMIVILGMGITYLALTTVLPQTTNTNVVNESIAMAANDTSYSLAHAPIYTAAPYTPLLKYANGTTISNYTFAAGGNVQTGRNIVPGTHYAYYTYYNKPWIAGTDYVWVISIFTFVMALAILAKFMRLF